MNEDVLDKEQNDNNTLPWIIFQVKKNKYAVNSAYVLSIISMTDELITIPDVQSYIRGVMNLRGSIIPLIDLKILFGESSFEKLVQDYANTISSKKDEIDAWVKELESYMDEDKPFSTDVDPKKCAFGKWLKSYVAINNSVDIQLKKLEEPYENLHQLAVEYSNCSRNHDDCTKKKCIKKKFKELKEVYLQDMYTIMDESVNTLKNSLKEMIIVLEYNNFKAGIIVDSVLSIELISNKFEQSEMNSQYYNTKYVTGVSKTDKSSTTVLTINIDNILSKAENVDVDVAMQDE